ncbi:hypothetical protein R3P38DRAFT_2868212 [Favolaschia claudopus]|uniref:PH domain-containing protein n=1 Tax=Favolaschia claudopus TaxID=2862362 RepID=A0AAW0D9A0_9AGAR
MSSTTSRRTSLLVHAGDALSLWRPRRRPSVRSPPPNPILAIPHVIDISAPPPLEPDQDIEERNRLRDAAAQSIGLGSLLEPAQEEPETEPETEQEQEPEHRDPVVLPPFPASNASLKPYVALAATLPKYYPPSSLRIFALANKQWKSRHLLLSVPAGTVSHLHLFKSARPGPDDFEVERLEINADSVVFVAESVPEHTDAVPAHVVKVAGQDVGALRKDWNPTDDAGRTVWLLQLSTPADAQRWISAIKSAIFDQRSQRAGLSPTAHVTPSSAHEPRGDMDVMLSMRLHHASHLPSPSPTNAQSDSSNSPSSPIPASPPPTARPLPVPPYPHPLPPTPTSPTYASSLAPSVSSHSVRSVATAPPPSASTSTTTHNLFSKQSSPRSQPPTIRPDSLLSTASSSRGKGIGAVAALKGLFSGGGGRQRSSSAASMSSFGSGTGSLRAGTSMSHANLGKGGSFVHVTTPKEERGDSFTSVGQNMLANGNANGHAGELQRRIVGTRDELTNGHVQAASEGTPAVHINGNASGKRRTFSMGGAFGMGGGHAQMTTALQPPPRRKRWTASESDTSGSSHPYANASPNETTSINSANTYFSPFAPASGTRNGRPGSATREYSYGSTASPGNGHVGKNGRPGSPHSVGSGSFSAGSPSSIGMYTHPHANGSAATAGSFGVPSLSPSGRNGVVRAGSVRSAEREGSVRTVERERDGRLSAQGRDRSVDRLSVSVSESGASSGTGGGARSRASSVGAGGGNTPGSVQNGLNPNGNGATVSSRRWSTLPQRLTPPAIAPPTANISVTTIPHPYAAAAVVTVNEPRPPSRSSINSDAGNTTGGRASRSSFGSATAKSWTRGGKRASGISIASVGSLSVNGSGTHESGGGKRVSSGSGGSVAGALMNGSASASAAAAPPMPQRSGSGAAANHRVSVPPPPRPAPTSALPPAPVGSGDGGHSPNGRTSFNSARESRTSLSSVRESTSTARTSTSISREARGSSISFREPAVLPAADDSNGKVGHSKSATTTTFSSSFRDRAFRLSLMAPKPPPASVLPPRPDETANPPPATQNQRLYGHRRLGSAGSNSRRESVGFGRSRASTHETPGNSGLYAIPSSPAFPPPHGPLPAPPPPGPAAPVPSLGRHTSLKLKQRLRILSAPPAPHPAAVLQLLPQPQHSTPESRLRPTSADASAPPPRPARSLARPGPMMLASFLSTSTPSTPVTATAPRPLSPVSFAAAIANAGSPPQTPIGEKIIEFHTQNDPSFLEMGSTPVISPRTLPSLSGPAVSQESEYAEIVSLPPPRRGSRQISIKDIEREPVDPASVPLPPDLEDEGAGLRSFFSISRHGSAVSLGIVTEV